MPSSSSSSPSGRGRRGGARKTKNRAPARVLRRRYASGKSSPNGTVKVAIPTDFFESRDLQKRIVDEVVSHRFHDNSLFAIKLALEEALNNALKHGNKGDPLKKVHVEYRVTPKQFEVTVEDEGEGFSRKRVPDPTRGENLTKCSGRGLLLIEAYMNKVEFSNGGRRLR